MIELVISGGQTGADQAGWRAAKAAGIPTRGWMPLGFLTEDGPRPEFADLYGACEHSSPKYPPRTYANAFRANATIWLGDHDSRGFSCTRDACAKAKTPLYVVTHRLCPPNMILPWIREIDVRILNVAGNRESKSPGTGAWAEAYLTEVFRLLRRDQP